MPQHHLIRHALVLSLTGLFMTSAAVVLRAQFQPRAIGGIGITVFEHADFRGRNATFRDDVPDLDEFGLDRKISSMRVERGEYWEGCREKNYRGRCQTFSGVERDLSNSDWNDEIRSLRRVGNRPYPPGPGPGPYPPTNRGLIVYSDDDYRGDSRTLGYEVDNFEQLNFNDRARSLRVAPGTRWEICVDADYRNCREVDRDVPDLNRLGMSRRLSSARPLYGGRPPYPGPGPGPGPGPSEGRLVLYDNPNFRGSSHTVVGMSSYLPNFANRAESVRVYGGTWELCEEANWRGRCITVSEDVRDLRSYGFRDRAASARPIRGAVPRYPR